MQLAINKLINGNVYVNGVSHFGKIEEVDSPDIKYKFAEHKGLGLIGTPEYFSGIEKIEFKLKVNCVYGDLLNAFANPRKPAAIQIRGNLEQWQGANLGAEVPYIQFITATAKNLPNGNFKRQDNVELDLNLVVYAIRVEIDGDEKYALDITNNTFRIGGVDIMATNNANLGL